MSSPGTVNWRKGKKKKWWEVAVTSEENKWKQINWRKKKGKTSKDAVEFEHWKGKHINKRVKMRDVMRGVNEEKKKKKKYFKYVLV